MRTFAILLLLACATACVLADNTAAATHAAPAAAAAPAGASAAAVAGLQSSLNDLESKVAGVVHSTSEVKNGLSALAKTVEDGLKKLSAADASEASAAADVKARLSAVEADIAEIKKLVAALSSAQNSHKADPALAEIKATQAAILDKLASSSWNFDYEAIFAQTKNAAYAYSASVSKFVQKTWTNVNANYPSMLAKLQELSTQGVEHSFIYVALAQGAAGDARVFLTQELVKVGVPTEFVDIAVYSILGLVGLIVFLSFWFVLKFILCTLCCCCCRSSKKSKKNKTKTQ